MRMFVFNMIQTVTCLLVAVIAIVYVTNNYIAVFNPVDSRKRPPQTASSSSDSDSEDDVEDSRKSPNQSTSSSSDSEDDIEDNLVKNVLIERYTYLRNNLRMADDLAAKLYGWKPQLLDGPTFKEITALNNQRKPDDAFQQWHDYAASWYTEESLKEFCKCLEDAGNIAKPKLRQVAKKIKKTLKGKQKAQKDTTDSIVPLPKRPEELDSGKNQASNIRLSEEKDPWIEFKGSLEVMTMDVDSHTPSPEGRCQSVAEDSVEQAPHGHVENTVHSSGPVGPPVKSSERVKLFPNLPILEMEVRRHKMYISILRTNVANKAGRRWKTLSDNLEVEPAIRDGFLATNLGVSNDATMSVLNHWAGGNTSKLSTWSALLNAMSASDMTGEADDLEKILLEGDPNDSIAPSAKTPQELDSENISPEDSHILRLKDHAYDQYKQMKIGEGVKMEYIRLAVLPSDPTHKDRGDRNKHDFLQKYRSCGVESQGVDHYIEPAKLLLKGREKVRVIYGHAGIGKTTLLKQVCRTLAKKEASSEYSQVLYFPLREKKVSQAKHLRELLSYYGSEDEKLDHSTAGQSLIDNKGRNILVIFDGADEVRELLENEDTCAFRKILEGGVLPEADVIVTSRPGSLPFLQDQSPLFYEIHGFDQASIDSYVHKFFQSSPGAGEKMLDELRSRPDLIGGAHIPMNLFIFCSIYQGEGFPPTITKCYEKYLRNKIANKNKKECLGDLSFKHLPDDVKPLLAALGKLAFKGMTTTLPNFVFNMTEVRQAFSNVFKADQTLNESLFKGLLHQHSSTVGCVTSSTFNFSHTTNQEFFCAYHFTQLPDDEQLQFVQKNFSNPKYAIVMRFYSGLTGLSLPQVASFLCYPDPQSSHPESSSQSSSLPSRCGNDNPHLLYLFHSLYESQNSDLAQNIVQQLNQSLQFDLHLTPHDFFAIAFCLSKCTHLRRLSFFHGRVSSSSLPHLFAILKAICLLQSLRLNVDHLPSLDASSLISATSVEKLYLDVMTTTLSALSAIFGSSTIKDLQLTVRNPVTDIDNESHKSELIRSVAENTTLRKLDLDGTPGYIVVVLNGIANAATIEDLTIQSRDGDDVAEALATTCALNTKLRRVQSLFISPLPVMKVLATKQVALEELGIDSPVSWWEGVFSEDVLKEMEKYAAEMRVVKFTMWFIRDTKPFVAVLQGISRSAMIEDLTVGGCLPGVDSNDAAEALANIGVDNTKLRRVELSRISPLPVMQSLGTRQVPLEELVILPPDSWRRRVFSEDELKEMEKYAAEMRVVKFTMESNCVTKPVVAVLQGISRSALIEDLTVKGVCDDDYDDVAEALANTCVDNTKLRRVELKYISPLPVMQSLGTRQIPLEELVIIPPVGWRKRVVSEDKLKSMEKYAAEMRVVKVTFNIVNNTGVCDAISTGLGKNNLLKQVTLRAVPEQKTEFVRATLSSIETVVLNPE